MSKTRRISGPSAYAMRELVGRLRYTLLTLLRAETRADANVELRRLDKSLQHWAAMHLPNRKEMVVNDGESTTDQPETVAEASVEEKDGTSDEVDRGKLPRCC